MGIELSTLTFKTDTSQLKEAADKIAALGVAIAELASKQKSAAEAAKDDAKAKKIQLKLESDLIILKEKLAKAEAEAATKANGTTEANGKAARQAESLTGLLSRLTNLYTDVAGGSTKWEAAILQTARTLKASDDQMKQVKTSLEQIAGLSRNPFDSAIGSIRSIQKEMDALNDRARLAAEGISLSTKQLSEYSRIGNEIRGQMQGQNLDPTKGSGLAEFNKRLAEQQTKYLQIADEVNRITAEEKKRNDVLTAQKNIMAGIEQSNKNIQENIDRNSNITSRMQGGMSNSSASTGYDNEKKLAGATNQEQLDKIKQQIDLTNKLKESEKLLNTELEKENALLNEISGLVAQRNAIDNLNKSILENISERTRMDALTKKYTDLGLNSGNAKELASAEFKGASPAAIDSLRVYLQAVQATTKALQDEKAVQEEVGRASIKAARDAAASRFNAAGHSSSISNTAAGMEVKGVPRANIDLYIQEATAKEQATKATRELAAANKFVTETEERLAAAANSANQNLNRQSTDELVKYQHALQLVGTSAEDTTRKLTAFKAQAALEAQKHRDNQLNHLSRDISTQMGDVGVSLAGGMNPLTVALQQGDQIRYALQRAGAEGAELQKAMNNAALQIASSVTLVLKAMSGFVTGIFITAYRSVENAAKGVWDFGKNVKDIFGIAFDRSVSLTQKIDLLKESYGMLSQSVASFGRVILGVAGIFTGMLLIAYSQVLKQEQALSKALVESGAAMGYSKERAVSFAESLNNVTTSVAVGAITEFANAGVRGSASIEKMMVAAIDLEKYGGASIEDTAKYFAKLQGEPMKALQDLAETSGLVTVATLEKAKAYKDAGDRASLVAVAEEELARVTEEKAKAMQASMSPIQAVWIGIKHSISEAWEEIQNLTKAGPIVGALKIVFQTVAVMATEAWYAVKGIGSALGALPAIGVAAVSDIKNMDMGFTETKRMAGIVSQASEENTAAYNKSIKSIMDIGKVNNEVGNQTAANLKLQTEAARSFGLATKEEQKNLTKVNKLLAERRTLVQDRDTAQGQGPMSKPTVDRFNVALFELDKKIKEAKDAEAKKARGPKGPTSSFRGAVSDVSLVDNSSNIQKEYQSELSKTEKFVNDQRSILKLSYEAGLVSKGEYLAKDIDLIQNGQAKELSVIQKYSAEMQAENDRMKKQVEERRADALGATSDSGSIIKINRDADDAITKLTESFKAFKALQQDKSDVIASESTKRYYESLKEQNQAVIEAKKHLEELNKTTRDATEARRMDAEFQMQALVTSGSELAMLKAKNDTMQGYIKIKDKLQQDLGKAEKEHSDFTSNTTFDGQNQEAIDKSFQQWQNIELLKQQIIQAGIDAELAARNAATDAFNKYYMDKATEVRDGTANAITEGIMNGGKAGSDAIKNVLNNILKDLLNNVFKAAIGSLGNSIATAISGQQTQQSSGGGFLQSLVGAGLSALGGGISGGFGGGASSAYSLTSGTAVDMTSGFKFRATGGFVNQGSEYIVGENGPEKFTPKQAGSITPNHKLANQSASSDPMKVTIINNTSSAIGKVTERQISPTERALVIEEAVQAVASAMHDPNHKVSKSLGQNYKMQRNR